jgi:hypothetical protein
MVTVTHEDIARLFPGIQDHTAVEIIETNAAFADLEAVALLLQGTDNELISIRREHGDRINRILDILATGEFAQGEDDRG